MKHDNDPQVMSVEAYIVQREKEAEEKGECKPRIRPNTNYTSFVLNEIEELDLEYTGKNEVLQIKLSDSEGKEVKYKTEIHNNQEYTYEVTKLDEKDKGSLDKDLKNIRWCFWIPKIKGFEKEQARNFIACINKPEYSTDFLSGLTDDTAKMNALKKHGVVYAKKEVIEKQGKKTAVLTLKFSKWLDGHKIKVEAYLSDKKGKGDTVATRVLSANPEIIETYWLNNTGRKITNTGYKQDVFLYLKTLGLQGKTIKVQVFDKDIFPNPIPQIGTDDQVEWKNNNIKIESREVIKQFKVGDKARYEEAQQDEAAEDNPIVGLYDFKNKRTYDLELYIHIANSEALNIEEVKPKYGQLNLIPKEKVINAFFAKTETEKVQADAPEVKDKKTKKTKLPPKAKVPYYEKLNDGVIGQKIQLVAECANLEGKEVVFKIYEKEKLLVEKDKELPVLQNDTEVTEIKATVTNGYAIAEVELQKVDKGKYVDWDKKLDPDTEDLKISHLFLKVSCEEVELPIIDKRFLNRNGKEFKLKAAVIVYHIYYDGKIEKNPCSNPQKAKYKYYESNNKTHLLVEAEKWKRKGIKTKPIEKVKLIDARNIESYSSGNVKFKISQWVSSKERWYIDLDCFAGLLGAMIEESIVDLGFTGFSDKNGSPGKSSTHLNGVAGDLRYLSSNKNGERTYLQHSHFDYNRQVKFNNALYKFGWGRKKKMLSEKFDRKIQKEIINPTTKKKELKEVVIETLLPYTIHYKKKLKNGSWIRHHHHIHIFGFDFSIIKTK